MSGWLDQVREALGILDLVEHGSPGDPGYARMHPGAGHGGHGASRGSATGGGGKAQGGDTVLKEPTGKPYVKMSDRQKQQHSEAFSSAVGATKVGSKIEIRTFNGGKHTGRVIAKRNVGSPSNTAVRIEVIGRGGASTGRGADFRADETATMRVLRESLQEATVPNAAGAADPTKTGTTEPTLPAKRRDGRIRQAINILIDAMGGLDDDEVADPVQQLAADAEAKARIKSALVAARESLQEALAEAKAEEEEWDYGDPDEQVLEGDPLEEASEDSGIILLEEKALRPDGTIKLKLISPGWGSKGYYSPEVLKRDGPKAWPQDSHMYWNHPTEQEEAMRPERDLRDLAAVTVTPPVYMENGPKGPGLYADAKVFGDYRKPLEEMAPHIGVSIRATGMATHGTAEGKSGPLVESILGGKSIDFVTKAGRGGEILQLFESARGGAYGKPVYDAGHQPSAEDDMSQAELEEAQRKLSEEQAENGRLRKLLVVPEAAKLAVKLLAPTILPGPSKVRLAEAISADPPITADGKLDEAKFTSTLAEAAKAEAAYVAQLTGQTGEVHGLGALSEAASNPFAALLSEGADMGGGAPAKFDEKATVDETTALLQSIGLSESVAKAAAAGRN
jgi:hypothetical protein